MSIFVNTLTTRYGEVIEHTEPDGQGWVAVRLADRGDGEPGRRCYMQPGVSEDDEPEWRLRAGRLTLPFGFVARKPAKRLGKLDGQTPPTLAEFEGWYAEAKSRDGRRYDVATSRAAGLGGAAEAAAIAMDEWLRINAPKQGEE